MFRHNDSPQLTFSPRAWLKWQFLCHAGSTEIGAFALSDLHCPLMVDDLLVVKQMTSQASVLFEDAGVADLFDDMADLGIPPNRFARIWLHTHPGSSVQPSETDEQTFDRVFGSCDWAVMGILGRTGRTYARLRFNAGPGGEMEIPIAVDWSLWPEYARSLQFQHNLDHWQQEFQELIVPMNLWAGFAKTQAPTPQAFAEGLDDWLFSDDFFFPRKLHEPQASR